MLGQNIFERVVPATAFADTAAASEIAFVVRQLLAVEQRNTFAVAVAVVVGRIDAAAAAAAAGGIHFVGSAAAVVEEGAGEWPSVPR